MIHGYITLACTSRDVVGGSTVDKLINCSWDDLEVVQRDWKHIMANCRRIGSDIFLRFFMDHPSYRNVFPTLAGVPEESLPKNEDFLLHSCAVLRGINTIMKNLSGVYEEDNTVLPIIGKTHLKRGVNLAMMHHLQECLVDSCTDFLRSTRKQKTSWKNVMDFIFKEYLCRDYPIPGSKVMQKNETAR